VLSALQELVARIVAVLPEAEQFALAGGAALVVAHVVDRQRRDLDYFGRSAEDVDVLAEVVEAALVSARLGVVWERVSRGFARWSVGDVDDTTEVDLAAEARIRPVESGPYGPTLSLEELAADKLLALFDRAQARDFVDVDALVDRFGLNRLCVLAAEKDRGFSRYALGEALGTFGRFGAGDLGVDETERQRLAANVAQWRPSLLGLKRRRTGGRSAASPFEPTATLRLGTRSGVEGRDLWFSRLTRLW
jgi:hypothetical protein